MSEGNIVSFRRTDVVEDAASSALPLSRLKKLDLSLTYFSDTERGGPAFSTRRAQFVHAEFVTTRRCSCEKHQPARPESARTDGTDPASSTWPGDQLRSLDISFTQISDVSSASRCLSHLETLNLVAQIAASVHVEVLPNLRSQLSESGETPACAGPGIPTRAGHHRVPTVER